MKKNKPVLAQEVVGGHVHDSKPVTKKVSTPEDVKKLEDLAKSLEALKHINLTQKKRY